MVIKSWGEREGEEQNDSESVSIVSKEDTDSQFVPS